MPGAAGIVQVVLVPGQALTLLRHGTLELPEKALVIDQPTAGYTLAATVDPLQLVVFAKAVKLGEFDLRQVHLLLELPQPLSSLALSIFGHFHHGRQTRRTTGLSHVLSAACVGFRLGEHAAQVLTTLLHPNIVVQALAQEVHQLGLQGDSQIRLSITTSHIGTHADQVATLGQP
ncbi:hypothetical protein D3C77_559580 [compost metagenome]